MATLGTVKLLSQCSSEDLEKQLPKGKDNNIPDIRHYQGTIVWLFLK